MADGPRMRLYESQRASMETIVQGFVPHWKDIANFIKPRRPRFFTSDANKGDRRNQKIIDSTCTQASETLESGMMAGLTSPSKKWFDLTLEDKDLMEYEPVRDWLYKESNALFLNFNQSNIYQELPPVYGDSGDFGTGCLLLEEDYSRVFRALCNPIGSYSLALNDKLEVDVFSRQMQMSARMLVQKFGGKTSSGQADWSKFLPEVKQAWEKGNYNQWFDVHHLIQPNENYSEKNPFTKKYSSCYWQKGRQDDVFLREGGYTRFPIMAPRWRKTGEDVWGTACPGMTALGDVKQLQLMQRKKAQAIEKLVDPPMQAPTSMENKRTSILPGDLNFVSAEGIREGGMRPVHEVKPDLAAFVMDIQDVRSIIRSAYKTDVFRALLDTSRRAFTAREVEELHQEKIGVLFPVMEQFNTELLKPLVEMAYEYRLKQGRVLPPPPEMAGMDIKVEFVSPMAQAQKSLGIAGIERFAGFTSEVHGFDPSVLDHVDTGKMIKEYAGMVPVPPGFIRKDEEVKAIQDHRAQVAKVQQGLDAAGQVASAAKDMSSAAAQNQNPLGRLMADAGAGSR